MYQVGDLIVYGGSGVCRVAGIGSPAQSGCDRGRRYYTLSPLYGTEVIYTPVDTKVPMRPILSREEAEQLIRSLPDIGQLTLQSGNLQLVARQYQDAFRPGDCVSLVRLMKTAYSKNTSARKCGKKPGQLEEKYRRRAESLLYGELAAALDIAPDEVPQYIHRALCLSSQPQQTEPPRQ